MTQAPEQNVIWQPQPGPQTLLLKLVGMPGFDEVNYGGAKGGGKTDGFVGGALKHWSMFGKHTSSWIFRKTQPELEQIRKRTSEIYPAVGGKFNSQKNDWVMPDGARIHLRSIERDADFSKYWGLEATAIWLDELANWKKPSAIDKLSGNLRSPHGIVTQLFSSCNPGGIGHEWVRDRYIEPQYYSNMREIKKYGVKIWRDDETGLTRVHIPARLTHNKILMEQDPGYVKRLVAACQGQPHLLKAWLEGDWDVQPAGDLMNYEWMTHYYNSRKLPAFDQVVMSVDSASKDKELNDPSVFTIWGHTRTHDYLLYVHRGKFKYPDLKKEFRQVADRWKPTRIYVEDKNSGTQLIQEMRIENDYPVIPIEPKGEKMSRFAAITGWFENGTVLLPESAPWLTTYKNELLAAPNTAHDDQIDSTSQYLFKMRGILYRSVESILNDMAGYGKRGESRIDNIDEVFAVGVQGAGTIHGLDREEMEEW